MCPMGLKQPQILHCTPISPPLPSTTHPWVGAVLERGLPYGEAVLVRGVLVGWGSLAGGSQTQGPLFWGSWM